MPEMEVRRLDTVLKKYMYTIVEEIVGCVDKCTNFIG